MTHYAETRHEVSDKQRMININRSTKRGMERETMGGWGKKKKKEKIKGLEIRGTHFTETRCMIKQNDK